MKLNVNNSGAWKHVLDFAAADEYKVKELVHRLGQAAFAVAQSLKWQLVNDQHEVCAVWTPVSGWKPWRSPSSLAVEGTGE